MAEHQENNIVPSKMMIAWELFRSVVNRGLKWLNHFKPINRK